VHYSYAEAGCKLNDYQVIKRSLSQKKLGMCSLNAISLGHHDTLFMLQHMYRKYRHIPWMEHRDDGEGLIMDIVDEEAATAR
jgi:hypothetical protein